MSDTAAEPEPGLNPFAGEDAAGGLFTLSLYSDSMAIGEADDVGIARQVISELEAEGDRVLSDEAAAANRSMWSVIEGGLSDGMVSPAEVPQFFRWLWASQSVTVITAAMVAAGTFGGLLLRYAQAHGYKPPVPSPLPDLPDLAPLGLGMAALIAGARAAPLPKTPGLTTGQRAIVAGAGAITPQSTTAPGLTKTEALAVQKAIGVASADVLRVMAKTFDLYLPGMHPGQVPASLGDLFTAAAILERQVHALQVGAKGLPTSATKGELTALDASVAKLAADVAAVQAELGLHAPSALDTHVNVVDKVVTTHTTEITHLTKAVEDLVGVAGVAGLATRVDKLVSQVDLSEPSALDSHVNVVDDVATNALRVAEDAEQCCEAQTGRLDNAVKSLGGSSALTSLGNLVAKAFGLTFLLGLADTLLAMADMPAVIKATAWDAETVAGYAASAAGVVESDFDWAGGWGNG
jgi:hypothetical protein